MHKPRLQRLFWLYTPSPIYFITTCTYGRTQLLNNEPLHRAFLNFCQKATVRGVFVGRYVAMPDYIHVFTAFAANALMVSDWMKSLKNALSRTLRENGQKSPHWQKGFFDHVLRSEESYCEKWQYVMMNPVRAGLVACIEAWPFQGEIHALRF